MKPNKVHCLFEQSGTFKNEFNALGIPAEDYDIKNDFGETDHIVDLFAEIDKAYEGKPSIFDTFHKGDLVMAFFPCTRFEDQIQMGFRGTMHQFKNWCRVKKIQYAMGLHEELHRLYMLVCKLFIICLRGGAIPNRGKPLQYDPLSCEVFPRQGGNNRYGQNGRR